MGRSLHIMPMLGMAMLITVMLQSTEYHHDTAPHDPDFPPTAEHHMDVKDEHFQMPLPPHEEPPHATSPISVPAPATTTTTAPESWKVTTQAPPHDTPFRGNWFKKRELVQEMRVLYEKLHNEIQTVWTPLHKQFLDAYGAVPEQMQTLEEHLGFAEQTLTEIEHALDALSSMNTTSTAGAASSASSPHVLPSTRRDIPQSYALLKEMRESFSILRDIHTNAATALRIVREQEPLGTQLDQQAWKYYEDIDAAYDDHQAAKLYEEIRALEAHMHELQQYVQGQLAPYLNHLIGQFDATVKHIESVYNALIKQDIVLRTADIPAPTPPPAPPAPPAPSWWQKILGWIAAPFMALFGWIKSLFGYK